MIKTKLKKMKNRLKLKKLMPKTNKLMLKIKFQMLKTLKKHLKMTLSLFTHLKKSKHSEGSKNPSDKNMRGAGGISMMASENIKTFDKLLERIFIK